MDCSNYVRAVKREIKMSNNKSLFESCNSDAVEPNCDECLYSVKKGKCANVNKKTLESGECSDFYYQPQPKKKDK